MQGPGRLTRNGWKVAKWASSAPLGIPHLVIYKHKQLYLYSLGKLPWKEDYTIF
jgi:hypothetical protein